MPLKSEILASPAYQEWLEHRRKIHPFPSDPYSAFMIDRALHAEVKSQDEWEKETNRADRPLIDLPPQVRRKMEKKERKRKPLPKKTRQERRAVLKELVKEISHKEGIEPPKLVAMHTKGYLRSQSRSRRILKKVRSELTGKRHVRILEEHKVEIGTKGSLPMVKAVTAHEVGHQVYGRMPERERKKMHEKFMREPQLAKEAKFGEPTTLLKEKGAWEIAKKHLSKVPSQRSPQL